MTETDAGDVIICKNEEGRTKELVEIEASETTWKEPSVIYN